MNKRGQKRGIQVMSGEEAIAKMVAERDRGTRNPRATVAMQGRQRRRAERQRQEGVG